MSPREGSISFTMKIAEEDLQEIRFTVVKGANPGSKIAFKPGTSTIRIGRAVDNDIVISDPSVSRQHVRVDARDGSYFIADAGSAAGVEKMGFRVGREPEPLESGDEFRLGDTIMRFELVAKKGALKKAAAREAAGKEEAPKAETGGSPIQRLLLRLGLKTPAMQIGAAALVAILLVMLLWPQPVELPPQASDRPMAINYNAIVGYNNVDSSHLDRAIFDVPTDAEALGVYFDLLPIPGMEIRSGNRPVGTLDPSSDWTTYQLLLIPKAAGKKPQLVFDNPGYSPEQGSIDPAQAKPWALRSMWVLRVASTGSSPAQLGEELEALRKLYDRIVDDPGNRYKVLQGLRHATLGLMKLAGRATLLVSLPGAEQVPTGSVPLMVEGARTGIANEQPQKALDQLVPAIQQIEGELNRDYRRELNAVVLARKKGSVGEEVSALVNIVKLIPDATDPRHRQAVSELQRLGYQPES